MNARIDESLGHKVDAALAIKDWETGLRLLEQWCDERPDNARGWFWRAVCLFRLRRLAEAEVCIAKTLTLSPENPRAQALARRIADVLERDDVSRDDPSRSSRARPDPQGPPVTLTDVADHMPAEHREPPPTVLSGGLAGDRGPLESEIFPNLTEKHHVHWKKDSVIEGRYEVRDVVHGGMGVVYFVFDTEMALELAVKTPLPKALATPSGRARFLREAEAWIGLGLHPNICSAYYVRLLGGVPRLFIEFVDGGNLEHWIRKNRGASAPEKLDLAIQIASGMHHAHTFAWVDEDGEKHQGVVHRDLKPANVLIGSDGIARVTDFGLVGLGSDQHDEVTENEGQGLVTHTGGIWGTVTVGGSAIGTPPYMPPEQWDRAHLAAAPADIYAFGCILYELFCNRRLFVLDEKQRHARPEAQLLYWRKLHREAAPPQPRAVNPDLDGELAALMVACVAKDPADRPIGFDDLRGRLKRIYAGIAGDAYPRPEPHATRLTGDALNNRAVSFATLGQEQRAERAWREALSVDPHHTEASYNLALFRWRVRNASDPDTSACMEEARRTHASHWRDDHLSGRVALVLGRWHDSLASLRAAVASSGNSPEVARDCGLALCAMARDTADPRLWQEACDLLSRCGGPLRKDPTLLVAYALAQHSLGRLEAAARLYSSALRRADNLPHDLEAGARRLIPGLHLQRKIPGLSGRIHGLVADRQVRTAATLTPDGTVTIWDCVDGVVSRTLNPKGPRPRCLAMTATGDRLLTSTDGDPVKVWDLETGKAVFRLQPNAGFLNAISITEDGARAAAVGTVGSLVVWNLESRAVLASHPVHEGFLTCLTVGDDGRTSIAGGSNGFVAAVDLEDGRIVKPPPANSSVVTTVAYDSQSKFGASGDDSGSVSIWDARTGAQRRLLLGHNGPIRFLTLKRGGTHCLSASGDGTVRIWDLATGRPEFSAPLGSEGLGGIGTEDWSSIILAGDGLNLQHWRVDEVLTFRPAWAVATPVSFGEAENRASEFNSRLQAARDRASQGLGAEALDLVNQARSVAGYERAAEALALSTEITTGYPHIDLRSGWEERSLEGHLDRVTGIAVDDQGSYLATAGVDRQVALWDVAAGALASRWNVGARPETSVDFVPGSKTVVTGGLDNALHLRSTVSGECTLTFSGHEAQVNQVVVDHLGQRMLSASTDGTARLWDLETGICLQILSGHGGEVVCCALSPDSRFAATGGSDGILLWNLETGRDLALLGNHTGAVLALAWSGDGRFLLSAGRDACLRLWDVERGECLQNLSCGTAVMTVALTPDDRFAATGDKDGEISIWNLKTGARMRVFAGHPGGTLGATFSPDGHRLFTCGADGLVRFWHLDWEVSVLPPAEWDDRLAPYLEVFLAGRGAGTGQPRWSRDDFLRLVEELGRRGYGWVDHEGIREQLKSMTAQWGDHTAVSRAMLSSQKGRRSRSPQRRRTVRLRRRAMVVVGVAAALFAIVVANRLSYGVVHFDTRAIANSRSEVMEAVVPPIPEFTRTTACDPAQFEKYVETFAGSKGEIWDIEAARHCLEVLGNPRAVGPALDMLRPRFEPLGPGGAEIEVRTTGAFTEVLSLLVRMGDVNNAELAEALLDPEPIVRTVATRALSYRGSKASIQTLLDRVNDREPLVRIAVSSALREIVSSGRIGRRDALRLFERLAEDNWPEVRRNVAANLRVVSGSAAKRLAHSLAKDRDEDVRRLAQETLRAMD